MNGITTAADVAKSGTAAVLFAAGGAVYARLLEKSSRVYRSPAARLWNWGILASVGFGGLIALTVAGMMALTGTTFR